jgi:hypothetical protein
VGRGEGEESEEKKEKGRKLMLGFGPPAWADEQSENRELLVCLLMNKHRKDALSVARVAWRCACQFADI